MEPIIRLFSLGINDEIEKLDKMLPKIEVVHKADERPCKKKFHENKSKLN